MSGPENYAAFGPVGDRFSSITGPVLASAATIAPVSGITHISGTAAISTITLPWPGFQGTITLVADGAWETITGGNISTAFQAVTGSVYSLTFDGANWI